MLLQFFRCNGAVVSRTIMLWKNFLTYSLTALFVSAIPIESSNTSLTASSSNQEYNDLVDYANIASIAYCLKRGLGPGALGNSDTNCPLKKCKQPKYKNIQVLATFDFNDWGEVGSGYYAIDHPSKRILLVFRGTSSTRDWIGDFDTVPVKYEPMVNSGKYFKGRSKKVSCEGCMAHRGFYNFVRNNCAKVISEVADLKDANPDYKLVIVGHSLGAALALLSGIEFQMMGLDPLVVSFGGPKVGNAELMNFADTHFNTHKTISHINANGRFKSGFIRVTHKNDMVPYLPPTSYLFEHGGFEYFINKKNLPHNPENVERRGKNYVVNGISQEAFPSLGKMWPDSMGKNEHTHYLMKITGCDDKLK